MHQTINRPLALIILDGWGVAPSGPGNAISVACTPFYDEICRKYPGTTLTAAGERIGIAPGHAGNAEVGHLNLGTGRAFETDAVRIDRAIASGSFFENPVLGAAIASATERDVDLHLIGLLSDSGIHSSPETLYALLRMAKRAGAKKVFVHAVLDGRDVLPRTADVYLEALEIKMVDIGVGCLATLCGRFFAMDSGENWERTARAFTMLMHAEGERARDAVVAVRNSFLRGISEEFMAPVVLEEEAGAPVATIKAGDVIVFFNHRADTMRQLARSVAVPEVGQPVAGKPRVEAVCMTEYERSFGLPVAFEPELTSEVLASILAERNIPNYRIAENDRFPHVTQFFNGGSELRSQYEMHLPVALSRAVYRETDPEMASFKVADRVLRTIDSDPCGVFVINLSAGDLVAETGNLEKTVEAVQFVDTCLGGIVERICEIGGTTLVTSSHGNCEEMKDASGEPMRSSTSNDVPFILVDDNLVGQKLRSGTLADVAPTMLGILGIEKPVEMTGVDLRIG